jgi:hypothetical protein
MGNLFVSSESRNSAQLDLFNVTSCVTAQSTSPLVGVVVQLQRTIDRPCRCGETSVVIGEPTGPHVAALYCLNCQRHRGWLRKEVARFLTETISTFGRSSSPIIIRDSIYSGHEPESADNSRN